MKKDSLLYSIALQTVPLVGPKNARNLIAYCGSPEAVFTERKTHLEKIPGIGKAISESILKFSSFDRVEKEMEFIDKHKIRALLYLDQDYPERLRDIEDSPLVLYCKGDLNLNRPKILAIVGTRKATEYGKRMCNKLIAGLKEYNVCIVSGLAFGIDHCAHKAALSNDLPTIGVLGHGLDTIYPSQHRSLAVEMLKSGALLTEYMSGTNPDRQNFPERNKIVAGMVDGVIVIESGVKGGALITANIAFSYNREVFAFPGKADEELSSGCNKLIKQNKAYLIESAADVAYNLGWDINKPEKKVIDYSSLNEKEIKLVEYVKSIGKTHIDQLTNHLQISISDLSVTMLELEFNGFIQALPGNYYRVVN